jgi:NitT/TauT family transport system ATP-binding protein
MLSLQNISKFFVDQQGQSLQILDNISLDVKAGEFVTIFGPNGAGKSTLMNIVSGLDQPTSGQVVWDRPDRQVSYLFQDYKASLLPWQTTYQNIALPLQWKGWNRQQIKSQISSLIEKFQIDVDLNAYPFTLSGGQAQLVSILRSLAISPDMLILDEPFSALDYFNSISLLLKLQEIWEKAKFTGLFISHNIDEAIFLGDRLVIVSAKPTTIVDVIEINLPRPRSIQIHGQPMFTMIKQHVLDSLALSANLSISNSKSGT